MKYLFISIALALSLSCGTRDYESPPDVRPAVPPSVFTGQQRRPSPSSTTVAQAKREGLVSEPTGQNGYVWRGLKWIGLSDSSFHHFRCTFGDSHGVSDFGSFGTAIFGGAVFGVIARVSGSWFFGKPIGSRAGHWFWNRLDWTVKNAGQGAIRGGVFGGVCQTLLAGGNLTPFDGLLGGDFTDFSTAVTVGTASAFAAQPWVERLMFEKEGPSVKSGAEVSEPPGPPVYTRNFAGAMRNIRDWSNSSTIGRGIRYRLLPGVVVVGIATGVGLLVYEDLQEPHLEDDSSPGTILPSVPGC